MERRKAGSTSHQAGIEPANAGEDGPAEAIVEGDDIEMADAEEGGLSESDFEHGEDQTASVEGRGSSEPNVGQGGNWVAAGWMGDIAIR